MLKNKLGYLVLLLIIGLFAILYNEYFTGILFLATILLPTILLIVLIIIKNNIAIEIDTKSLLMGKNELFDIAIRLDNKSWFPISRLNVVLEYYNEYYNDVKKEQIQVSLDRSSSQIVTCQIDSTYCGYLNFVIKNIRVYDYFYIWSMVKKINKSIRVAVVPEYYEISQDLIVNNDNIYIDNNMYSEYKPGDDVGEIYGIREYRAGDRPNRIHWKLSYKQDELMMKEFSDPINSSIVIILDLFCGKMNEKTPLYVDGLMETVFSISYSCLTKKHTHTLFWYDNNLNNHKNIVINNEQDFFTVVDDLLKADLHYSYQSVLTNHNLLCYKEQFTHMIYVTTVINEEEIMNWINNRKGTYLYVIYVNFLRITSIREEFRAILKESKVFLFEIDLDNLKESIQAIELI